MKKVSYLKDLFLTHRFYALLLVAIVLYLLAYFVPFFIFFAHFFLIGCITLFIIDYALLFFTTKKIVAHREVETILSHGDPNNIIVHLNSDFAFKLDIELIDEIPFQFQLRDFTIQENIAGYSSKKISYLLRPTQRGEYHFGNILIYASSTLKLIQRRFIAFQEQTVQVFPSYIQLKNYSIKSVFNKQIGEHTIKQKGASTEFDHVKEYVMGDDVRTINWKASARKNDLMINAFVDEKSQQIYCVLDKSRLMKMPFEACSLLDYSINAIHTLTYVSLQKKDKVGLVTFCEKINDVLIASKNKIQFNQISQLLYNQTTQYLEANLALVYNTLRKIITQRSLIILFTNIETLSGLDRNMAYYKAINRKNLLCLIMFENSEMHNIYTQRGDSLEDIYVKTIADKFSFEKRMIVKELQKNGILVIYTTPQQLTTQVVNKYLEIKAKRMI